MREPGEPQFIEREEEGVERREVEEEWSMPTESILGDVHGFDYEGNVYDAYRINVLAESLPEEVMPVDFLRGQLEHAQWSDKEGKAITSEALLSLVQKESYEGEIDWKLLGETYPELEDHFVRLERVDWENRPISIVGKDHIIDGMHRLAKATLEGSETIKVKRFKEIPEEAILSKELQEELRGIKN